MSYTVTIKNNDTGEILEHETNVKVIMGARVIRHDELRCHSENFMHSSNKTLCGNAWLGIKKLHEDLPAQFPWLAEAAVRSISCAFDTKEEMEAAIKNDIGKD